jgi:hypothetical protein
MIGCLDFKEHDRRAFRIDCSQRKTSHSVKSRGEIRLPSRIPAVFAVGDAARNESSLRNPFASNELLALAKKFFFGEKATGELRMEYFNVLNRMQVCGPAANGESNNNVSNPRAWNNGNFGYVVGPCQAKNPRQGQAYFRVNF